MKKQKTVKDMMEAIRQYLVDEYGCVQPQWELTLMMLADNITTYIKCQKEIDTVGIFDKENYRKNPLLSTVKDLQATILKEVQHLGISPYAVTKISNLNDAANDSDFLKNLMLLEDEK